MKTFYGSGHIDSSAATGGEKEQHIALIEKSQATVSLLSSTKQAERIWKTKFYLFPPSVRWALICYYYIKHS